MLSRAALLGWKKRTARVDGDFYGFRQVDLRMGNDAAATERLYQHRLAVMLLLRACEEHHQFFTRRICIKAHNHAAPGKVINGMIMY